MSSISAWIVLVVSFGYSNPGEAIACLPGAITPANRKNISVGDGSASMPLKLCSVTWTSGSLLHHAARIVLQEKLGYNVEFGPSVGQSRRTWMQVADCNSTDPSDRCFQGPPGSVAHLAFEIWESYALGMEEKLALEVPGRVPFVVGELGALGTEAYFIRDDVIQAASKQGLFLQWYESYNASWSSAQTYFASHTELPVPDTPCQDVSYMQGTYLDDYVNFTGDIDAVVVENGQRKRKCDANGWALSPACRKLVQSGAAGCIPAISYGGWGFHDLAQKAAFYEMPLAIGAFNWAKYIDIPKKNSTFTYWWTPDSALLHSDPVKVIFPAYDADEYSEGIYKSAMAGTRLFKLSSAVIASEVQVQEFVRLMEISIQSIMKLVVSAQGVPASDHEAVACAWLQNNPKVWEKWLPDSTKCIAKQGLVDSAGNFSTEADVNNAIRCEFCAFGRHSDSIQIDKGSNFICRQCEEGRFQSSLGQTSCSLCDIGSFSLLGQRRCELCAKGKYTSITGATQCSMCPDTLTTLDRGAQSASECQCSEGFYSPLNTSSDCRFLSTDTTRCACIACPEGMTCNFANKAKNFKAYGGNDELIPLLEEGYYSLATEPLSIYKCSLLSGCPGGVPQSCKHTRTNLVCAVCPDSWSPNSDTGECEKCSSAGVLLILLGPIVIIVIISFTYYAANSPLSLNATITLTMSVTAGLAVTVLQVFGVFNQLSIPWPQTSSGMFKFFTIFLFSADSFSMECGVGSDATMLYLYRILTPFCFVASCWFLYLFSGLVAALSGGNCARWKANRVWNTIGQISQMLFIAFAVIAVRPFECAPHPNGTSSLILFPQILCWESDHSAMVTMAVFLLVLYLAPFAALCSWAIIKSPAISQNDPQKANVMLVRFRFLMYRFRPDKWWWGLVFLLRQTLLAFASSLPADDPHSQIMYTSVTLSVYLALMCCAWPWKNHTLNCLDCGTTLGMLLVIVTATAFLPAGSQEKDNHVTLLMFFIFGLLAYIGIVLVLIGYNILRNGITGEFGKVETGQLETNKLAQMWIDWQAMILKIDAANINDMVRMMNQYDRQVLVKAVAVWENACGPLVPPDVIAGLPGTQMSSPRLRNLPHSTAPVSAEKLREKTSEDLTRKLRETNSGSSASYTETPEKQVKENPVIESPVKEHQMPKIPMGQVFDVQTDGREFHMSPRGTPRILASRVWTTLGPLETPRSGHGNLTPRSRAPETPRSGPATPRGGGGEIPRSPRY